MLSRTKLSRPLLGQRSESELRDQSPIGSFVESSWVERSPPTINSVTTATMIAYSDTESLLGPPLPSLLPGRPSTIRPITPFIRRSTLHAGQTTEA